jgi:SNF2 family DNA or RNA helicase
VALVDVRTLPYNTRLAAAERLRTLRDFTLPPLDYFNSDPCPAHASIDEGATQIPPCRACGVRLRKHQRVGVAWLWMRGKGLIADQVGTGKTAQAAGLLACAKQVGELDTQRALIVVRPAVLAQWHQELARFLPKLSIATATGTRAQRIEQYLTGWDTLIAGFKILCNDLDLIDQLNIGTLIIDDIDALRTPSNQTAYSLKRIARRCDRVVVLTGTPLQKKLHELHSILECVGGLELLGSATTFRNRYVREELVRLYNPRAGRMVCTRKLVGYKNLDDFKARVAPLCLRRTPADIDDVDLPVISPHTVYLDLHPAQRQRYEELRRGVLTILRREGNKVRHTTARAQFLHGAQICAGLSTLGEPDGPGSSAKLDWVMTMLDGDLAEEKAVIFCQFKPTVAALAARLTRAGIGHVIIWGRERDPVARAAAVNRFWNDSNCRVMLGTTAMEQGLNLQVARHLINVDQIMNPARMQQLAGRIRRDGSAYQTVYVHNLLSTGTQEEGYLDVLAREQALADYVWDENNQLYDALSPMALLQLIGRPSRGSRA